MIHKFVEFIPENLEEGIIYITIKYATAVHSCACGCGKEVVTPLSPTDWKLTYDGATITLSPSIGNWNFECKSHYWIINSEVEWADQWSNEMIQEGRTQDRYEKSKYYKKEKSDLGDTHQDSKSEIKEEIKKLNLMMRTLRRMKEYLFSTK
ncbi:MAG: DUF6527 family protein [Candidatus Delongbacteria bacterium]|jgi:hypothetical protein|nr:DUF6527 family protein [Candidatus Delongbacteria bacterium]